ncbi:hypothetical protein [Streptomyces sp. bgisy084]|uniref:hypothetical protein n=1 Tax=Streptomyces sp. bgisy084 TaxID=3413777 RepID=UPI003D70C26C
MERSNRLVTVCGAAAAAFLLATTPATADPQYEVDTAGIPFPSGRHFAYCASADNSAALGCYDPKGEWFQVVDYEPDGKDAVVKWELYRGNREVIRKGKIFNRAGFTKYRYKNKSFKEGLRVRLTTCVGDYPWVNGLTCSSIWAKAPS